MKRGRRRRRSYLRVLDRKKLLRSADAGKRDRGGGGGGGGKIRRISAQEGKEDFGEAGGAYQPRDSGLIQSGTEIKERR